MLDLFLDLKNPLHRKINHLSKEVLEEVLLFKPVIVGTYPIGINIESSDIDVIISYKDLNHMKELLMVYKDYDNFSIKLEDVLVCNFKASGFEFEIYVDTKPIETFNSYRHLVIERDLLNYFGQDFRQEIIELKRKGVKTEPAFAALLGLFGNPYDALLKLADKDYSDLKWSNDFKKLSFYNDYKITYLNKGWSFDLKFKAGPYLIRQTSLKNIETKRMIFREMKRISKEMTCSKPIAFLEGRVCIQVYEWLEGVDLEFHMDGYDKKTQYEFGKQAGTYLSIIQSEKETFDWYEKYKSKIDRTLSSYKDCGIHMSGQEAVIDYIRNNHEVLKGRPITFQHGDYHVGNMIIKDNKLGIIDFNRSSLGDPWEEYDRIAFSYRVSPYFAVGQLHGYFDQVPDEFFKVLALYSAVNALAGIPWAIPFGEKDVQVMKDNYTMILNNYDSFKTYIPKWYSQTIEEIKKW